jgi:hypothetical protein
MKRTGQLFERVIERDNLRLAFARALCGKRSRSGAREFGRHLDRNLEDMAARLAAGTVAVGQFRQFVIHDPKERIITAPCFAERVLHHAIMNVCEPYLDRWLIGDTYACRTGKGRIAALARAGQFAGRFPFFLKLDIRKYFDSVPHEQLLERLARRFKDRQLLALLGRIVRSFRGSLGRGIPIGSLTSQHLANFYLGWFDRFAKESLRVKGYIRYMDDMALWAETKATLEEALSAGEAFLRDELRLELKATPYLNRTEHGMDYLGCRVFRQHTTLNRRSRQRFRRKLARLEQELVAGRIDEWELQHRATALVAFTRTERLCSWRFRRAALQEMPVSGH